MQVSTDLKAGGGREASALSLSVSQARDGGETRPGQPLAGAAREAIEAATRSRSNPGPDDRRSPGRRSHTRRCSRLRNGRARCGPAGGAGPPRCRGRPACGRGGHNLFRHDAQPWVTAITRERCRDGGRTGIRHDVRIAGTAHLTHRQEVVPGRYRGLEQRRCLSPNVSTRAIRGNPSRVPAAPIHRVLRHCSLCCPALATSGVIIAVFSGRITVPGCGWKCACPPRTRRRSIYDSRGPVAGSLNLVVTGIPRSRRGTGRRIRRVRPALTRGG